MGSKEEHIGPPQIRESLRAGLLDSRERVNHWLCCPECDPNDEAYTMLRIVGWTHQQWVNEGMSRA